MLIFNFTIDNIPIFIYDLTYIYSTTLALFEIRFCLPLSVLYAVVLAHSLKNEGRESSREIPKIIA